MNQKIKTTIKPVTTFLLPAVLTACVLTACSPSGDNTPDNAPSPSSAIPNTQTATTETSETAESDFPYAFEKVAEKTWVIHRPRELPNP